MRAPGQRGTKQSRENLIRAWLMLRRKRDGLKGRDIAAEFGVSNAYVFQELDKLRDLTTFFRHKHGICTACGKGDVDGRDVRD